MKLVFSDYFPGSPGSAPNPKLWTHETGPGAEVGGNNELELYVNDRQHSFLTGGTDGGNHLVIRATHDADGVYRSARLTTIGHFAQYQGKFQARIKYNRVPGCWPAFWMMGINPPGWPTSGEVDIFEVYGIPAWAPTTTVWLPKGSTMTGNKYSELAEPDGQFHVYEAAWSNGGQEWTFSVDGVAYWTLSRASAKIPASEWPYANAKNPMHMILNMAVGGDGGGDPSATKFPVDLTIGYVRVYA